MDFGKLNITNAFIYDGQEGTLSYKYKSRMPSRRDFVPSSMPAVGSSFDRDSIMSRSVYGSLDEDYRGPMSHEHSEEAGGSAVLSSFYSALGVSSSASVSSSIVQPNDSKPCVSTSIMSSGMYHSAALAASAACSAQSASNCSWNDADMYSCLLDVMHVELCDMEVYSACWKSCTSDGSQLADDTKSSYLVFQSFIIQREVCMILLCSISLHMTLSIYSCCFMSVTTLTCVHLECETLPKGLSHGQACATKYSVCIRQ